MCSYRLENNPIPVGKEVILTNLVRAIVPKRLSVPTNKIAQPNSICKVGMGFAGKCIIQKNKFAYPLPDLDGGVWTSMFSPVITLISSKMNAF